MIWKILKIIGRGLLYVIRLSSWIVLIILWSITWVISKLIPLVKYIKKGLAFIANKIAIAWMPDLS